MKKTCDMVVGETYQQEVDGKLKTFVISSKETNVDGFLIVHSTEVIA